MYSISFGSTLNSLGKADYTDSLIFWLSLFYTLIAYFVINRKLLISISHSIILQLHIK